ncbi:hypothetical protein ACGFIV_24445 [Sphaerisporangium sp. NPDC049003]|uniref:hypothetical protein n=1 Tax=Sphaerisporangium sp. NPDC049003 TaxID=3364517 RepID=UPI003715A0FC
MSTRQLRFISPSAIGVTRMGAPTPKSSHTLAKVRKSAEASVVDEVTACPPGPSWLTGTLRASVFCQAPDNSMRCGGMTLLAQRLRRENVPIDQIAAVLFERFDLTCPPTAIRAERSKRAGRGRPPRRQADEPLG